MGTIGVVGRQDLLHERRLLRDVVAVARRCEHCVPLPVLDAVLRGTSAVRPVVPAQSRIRRRASQ
jgi:hypothetical protein